MKKIILIVFIILLIAIGTTCGYFYYIGLQEKNNDPKEVLTSYFEALKNKNYEEMYLYISEDIYQKYLKYISNYSNEKS